MSASCDHLRQVWEDVPLPCSTPWCPESVPCDPPEGDWLRARASCEIEAHLHGRVEKVAFDRFYFITESKTYAFFWRAR